MGDYSLEYTFFQQGYLATVGEASVFKVSIVKRKKQRHSRETNKKLGRPGTLISRNAERRSIDGIHPSEHGSDEDSPDTILTTTGPEGACII